MQLAQYRLDTGEIVGIYEAQLEELLDANRVPDDPVYGYLRLETDIMPAHQCRYEIVEQTLVARQQVEIDADPLVFHADGLDECLVTITPWQPCTLLVVQPYSGAQSVYHLTDADPMLVLTSDLAQQFVIGLAPTKGIWAEPLTVEANDAAP